MKLLCAHPLTTRVKQKDRNRQSKNKERKKKKPKEEILKKSSIANRQPTKDERRKANARECVCEGEREELERKTKCRDKIRNQKTE
jgi:hypothetical protein